MLQMHNCYTRKARWKTSRGCARYSDIIRMHRSERFSKRNGAERNAKKRDQIQLQIRGESFALRVSKVFPRRAEISRPPDSAPAPSLERGGEGRNNISFEISSTLPLSHAWRKPTWPRRLRSEKSLAIINSMRKPLFPPRVLSARR